MFILHYIILYFLKNPKGIWHVPHGFHQRISRANDSRQAIHRQSNVSPCRWRNYSFTPYTLHPFDIEFIAADNSPYEIGNFLAPLPTQCHQSITWWIPDGSFPHQTHEPPNRFCSLWVLISKEIRWQIDYDG